MARDIEIKVKVKKQEYEKFVKEFDAFKKAAERQKLNLGIKRQDINYINQGFAETINIISSLGAITRALKPLDEALGINLSQYNNIISSLGGIATGINTIRKASGLLSKSFGWIGLLISAGGLVYDLGKKFGFFADKVELSNKKLQGQLNAVKELYGWNEKTTNKVVERLNALEELREKLKTINDLLKIDLLDEEKKTELIRQQKQLKAEIITMETQLKGIGKDVPQQQRTEKLQIEGSLNEAGKAFQSISKNLDLFNELSKIDTENKQKWYDKIDREISKLYELYKMDPELKNREQSTIAEFLKALKSAGDLTTEELNKIGTELRETGTITAQYRVGQKEALEELKRINAEEIKERQELINAFQDAITGMIDLAANIGSNVNDTIIGLLDILDGDTEKGVKSVLDSTFATITNIAQATGDPIIGGVAKAVEGVYKSITSLWDWFGAKEKQKQEAFLKNEEKKRKDKAERENLLAQKEVANREKELKLRDEHLKKLNKNFSILEDAFLQGVIGLDQYLNELTKKETAEVKYKEEKEELDLIKQENKFKVELNKLKEQFYKENPQLVGKDLSRDTIQKMLKQQQGNVDYWNSWAGTWDDTWRFGYNSLRRDKEVGILRDLEGVLKRFNKFEETVNLTREGQGLDRISLSPIAMSPEVASQSNANIILNIEIKTIVDPADPSSLRKLTNSIIEEINKLRISGVVLSG